MKSLPQALQQKFKEITDYFHNIAPHIVGVEAVNHFKASFLPSRQGFTDKALQPWKEVQRRQKNREGETGRKYRRKYTEAEMTRPILTQTGDLKDSIDYTVKGDEIKIFTEGFAGKAQAHNEGTTTAGRGNSTTIPKRQFMGPSEQLNKIINDKFDRDLEEIHKKS